MAKVYTYASFATDCIALANGEPISVSVEDFIAKANDLAIAQANKAAYNATHPRKSTAKGASEKTMAVVNVIKPILSVEPMTATDINAKLGTEFTALQVANAIKYIEGVNSCKVVRATVNAKGLRSEKEYTAYKLG